jgi:hypothetical protein
MKLSVVSPVAKKCHSGSVPVRISKQCPYEFNGNSTSDLDSELLFLKAMA